MQQIESDILLFFQSIRFPLMNFFMLAVTYLAEYGWFWILITLIFMAMRKTRVCGFCCAVSLIIEFILCNLVLKKIFLRVRPYYVIDGLTILTKIQPDTSFPSGHTGIAFAVAVVLLIFSIKKKIPPYIGFAAIAIAVLTGISRIYIGVHYPTDVLAGAILGVITAFAGIIPKNKFEKIM